MMMMAMMAVVVVMAMVMAMAMMRTTVILVDGNDGDDDGGGAKMLVGGAEDHDKNGAEGEAIELGMLVATMMLIMVMMMRIMRMRMVKINTVRGPAARTWPPLFGPTAQLLAGAASARPPPPRGQPAGVAVPRLCPCPCCRLRHRPLVRAAFPLSPRIALAITPCHATSHECNATSRERHMNVMHFSLQCNVT